MLGIIRTFRYEFDVSKPDLKIGVKVLESSVERAVHDNTAVEGRNSADQEIDMGWEDTGTMYASEERHAQCWDGSPSICRPAPKTTKIRGLGGASKRVAKAEPTHRSHKSD